ncbi:hypothetical protein N0V90_007519 [Kalmusia sp. IMI 367209]|nr:hypothetical protein N0V90_007519 [Kalmusia sp. IMI 367209]
MYTSTLLAFSALASPSIAAYAKVWDYNSNNFWDNFNFIAVSSHLYLKHMALLSIYLHVFESFAKYNLMIRSLQEPDSSFTNGFAQYVGIDEALSSGLAKINNGKVRLGVDSTNTYSTSSTGRKSLRLQSWGYFDNGLLVADFNHVPVAGWVYQGEQSTTYSEIDILENVNKQTQNTHSLYTSEQCTINVNKGSMVEGKTTNCHYDHNIDTPQGCSFYGEQGTFNQPFNDQYKLIALQVESDRIKIWHFKKTEVPADLSSANPNPDAWTKAPTVYITPKSCNFVKAFRMFHIVINITFCGGWAGDDFKNNNASGQCKAVTGTSDCKAWVANHPTDFANTYFEFNSIKLYQRT